MKKKFRILLTIFLSIILGACSNLRSEEITDLILTPEQASPVLAGTWQVTMVEAINENTVNPPPEIGDKLYITDNLAAINNEYAFPPSFSSKFVNLNEYLLNRGYEFTDIDEDEDVVVVNVSQGQFFARDFVKRSDDEIFYIADDYLISLTKLSNNVEADVVDKYTNLAREQRVGKEGDDIANEDISLLLGVRERIDLDDGLQDYYYFTYLINIPADGDIKWYKSDDIFLRSNDEYWKVRSRKNTFSGMYDNIEAFPARLEDQMGEQTNLDRYTFRDFNMNIRLNYADRDYISFSYAGEYFDNSITKYAFVETNDLVDNRLLTIEEFTGENDANEQFKNMVINEATTKVSDVDPDEIDIDDTNFGLVRDIGMWVTQTSIYTKDSQLRSASQIPFRSNIDETTNTPTTISRDQVRNINPQLKDYYILTNEDYVVIQTTDEILLYRINDGYIADRPILSIPTPNPTAFVSIDQQQGQASRAIVNAYNNFNTIVDSN